jgi:hypothetical protein
MEYIVLDQNEYMLKIQYCRIICTSTNYNIFGYLLLPLLSVDLVSTMIFLKHSSTGDLESADWRGAWQGKVNGN